MPSFNSLPRSIRHALVIAATMLTVAHAQAPKEVRLDYAYYSPPSLVLKKFGWLEQDLKADNVPVRWVLSLAACRA